MAINPIDNPCDKTVTLSRSSLNHYKHGNSPATCLVKMDFVSQGSMSSLSHKHEKHKNNSDFKSPYLKHSNHPILGDSVQLLSRVTEKRVLHKNGRNISSFPLAGDIYKANSNELKGRQTNRKILKSVLTLPNNAAPARQLCIMSDMKDSEYVSGRDDQRRKAKKRNSEAHLRKFRRHPKGLESESQYCSDMNIRLDCSSTDTIKKCGDGIRIHKATAEAKSKLKEKVKPHDVWAILRNMNRFQFQTSPQLSEDSFIVKQQRNRKRQNNRKDMRVFETRRTEEYAYISSYKVDKSHSFSRCSSFDKITVIDKNQDFKVGKEIEDNPKKKKTGKLLVPRAIKSSPRNKSPLIKRNNLKAITYINQVNRKKNNNIDNTEKNSSVVVSPNYGNIKGLLKNNASVDLGYESKTTENDEDLISIDFNTTNTIQPSPYSQSKLSDNSDSNKAAAFTKRTHKRVKSRPKVEPDKQVNGITKVILSRGLTVEQSQQHNKIELPKRSTRHVTVTPSCPASPPKLTKTEINRQLHKYKFPVIILGNDQLRSSIHVVNVEHPQFDGLEEQMWPFMRSWYGIERPVNLIKKPIYHNVHSGKTKIDEIEKKVLPKNVPKPTKILDKGPKIEHKRAPLPLSEIISQTTQNQRKPIRQLKDRMLKLLYKNSSELNVIDGSPNSGTGKTQKNTVDNNYSDTNNKHNTKNTSVKVKKSIIQTSLEKRPWAKAKWASNFIENVIKKIKSGAYYNQEGTNKVHDETLGIDKKDTNIQTESTHDVTSYTITDESIKEIVIPGFDNILPVLEIKTMSIKEVAVKHCGTNIMVHFDVTIPTYSIVDEKNESSLIPIDITKSLTKVFKCQTSILNAMLPAELCSILPKMLRDIVDSGQHLMPIKQIDIPGLTTISESPIQTESFRDVATPMLTTRSNILQLMLITPKLQQLLNGGHFQSGDNTTSKFHVLNNTSCLVKDYRRLAKEMSLQIKRIHLFEIESQLNMSLKVNNEEKPKILPKTIIKPIEKINTCTALQPYPVIRHSYRPILMPRPFSLMNLLETMASYINNIGLSCFRMIKTDGNLAINMNMVKSLSAPNVVTLRIDNLITHSPDCLRCLPPSKISILSHTDETVIASSRSIEKVKSSFSNERALECYSFNHNNNKTRRKGHVKLYRKCKSFSNIAGEKITPLNRISNLDDFFQALGSAKLLSGVFDGQSGNKIMSSIKELQNWTTEINPRQALLVILLANKKDTPNLLRYRPMLLQGIAVKRITKTIELDMEIEVIERENLNGVSRFEGISYLPASIENQDSLYEELCWIAKNTASDYQRPFDHTSEKLIKSLLEKRKQLNPSYLRVMARYVGLGLLKSPRKVQ